MVTLCSWWIAADDRETSHADSGNEKDTFSPSEVCWLDRAGSSGSDPMRWGFESSWGTIAKVHKASLCT